MRKALIAVAGFMSLAAITQSAYAMPDCGAEYFQCGESHPGSDIHSSLENLIKYCSKDYDSCKVRNFYWGYDSHGQRIPSGKSADGGKSGSGGSGGGSGSGGGNGSGGSKSKTSKPPNLASASQKTLDTQTKPAPDTPRPGLPPGQQYKFQRQ